MNQKMSPSRTPQAIFAPRYKQIHCAIETCSVQVLNASIDCTVRPRPSVPPYSAKDEPRTPAFMTTVNTAEMPMRMRRRDIASCSLPFGQLRTTEQRPFFLSSKNAMTVMIITTRYKRSDVVKLSQVSTARSLPNSTSIPSSAAKSLSVFCMFLKVKPSTFLPNMDERAIFSAFLCTPAR